MKGIQKYWHNDIFIFRYHYSARRGRDTDTPEGFAWMQEQLKGYEGGIEGADWLQEMEICFELRGPKLVFPNLKKYEEKIFIDPIEIKKHWTVYYGYDYGWRAPWAGLAVAFASPSEAYVCWEGYEERQELNEQAQAMMSSPFWRQKQYIIGDPSIWMKNQHGWVKKGQTRVSSIGHMLRDLMGVKVREGHNEPGIDLTMRNLLKSFWWEDMERPRLKIFKTCPNLWSELQALKFKDYVNVKKIREEDPPEKLVNKRNHAWDALKYILTSRPTVVRGKKEQMPANSVAALRRELDERKKRVRRVFA